jgi:hypothetical protein
MFDRERHGLLISIKTVFVKYRSLLCVDWANKHVVLNK